MVFSLWLWPTTKFDATKMQENRRRSRRPCGCGGAMLLGASSPNEAQPGIHLKPMDAAIGQALASHRRGDRRGRKFRPETQNANKKLFLAG